MGHDAAGAPVAPPPSPVRRRRPGSLPAPLAASTATPCLRPGSVGSCPLPRPASPVAPPPPSEALAEAPAEAPGAAADQGRPALEEALEEHRRSLEACIREASAVASEWGCRLEGLVVKLATSLEAWDPRCDSAEEVEVVATPRCLSCGDNGCSLCQGEAFAENGHQGSGISLLQGALRETAPKQVQFAKEAPSGELAGSITGGSEFPSASSEIVDVKRRFKLGNGLSGRLTRQGQSLASCSDRLEIKMLEPPRPVEGFLGRMVSSKEFEAYSALVIIANAVYIAYVSDLEMKSIHEDIKMIDAWFWLEMAFTGWYAFELSLRLFVYRWTFYLSKDWCWNLFDTVLVLSSLQDMLLSVGTTNPAFLRVMRLARMLKLLRVIRLMRMFRELRLILNAILSCMKSMFWAMLLILNVSFIFGLCFLQATADYLREQGDQVDENHKEELLTYWGSCRTSMYSLYAAALGGIDWDVQANSLHPVGSAFFLLFLLYIGFFYCVITNTLTSLFVEATMANAEKDQQQVIQAELEQKEVYVQQLQRLFLKIGGQHRGEVTLYDFLAHIEDPEMVWFATNLGIDMIDLKQFFSVLSSGGQKLVDLERFVTGCIRFKGAAKSMDLMDMKLTLKEESADVRESLKLLESKIEAVASAVEAEASRRRQTSKDRFQQRPGTPSGLPRMQVRMEASAASAP